MKPLQLILSRMVLIVLLFSMGTPSIAEQVGRASYPPSNCHALKRTSISKAENTPNPELYAAYKEVEKWDILCIGRTVVIDSALESNGGDIFIYADELTLKAPIDTRSRRTNTEVIYKQQWDAVYPLALAVVRDYNIRSIADQNRDYAQYEFPPGESQFPLADCETAAHPERSREKLSGEPPPTWGPNHFSSGDVHIFANSVMVEKSAIIKVYKGDPLFCGMNPPEPPPIFPEVNGRYPHYEEAVIVTAGMHGGRGGMGKLFMPFVGTHGFSCVDEARIHIGEVNGPGGNGGDAGSIFLYKIGRTNETPTWDATLKMEVNGGDPGSNRIIRGPSANELSNIQGNICALHDQGKYQEGTRGAKGNIISQLVTPTKAVELVSNLLSIKDGRNDYVMDELAQRASTDRRVIAITFQEFMEKKFADELQEEQVAYIDDLMNYLLVDKRLEAKSYNALHSFDLNSTPLQKLPNLYKILSEFQNFQPMNDNYNVEVLFTKTGGALKIDSLNRYNAFSKTVESIDSAKKDVTVNELKKLVGDAVDQLTQIKGSLFRTEFKQRGEELNSTLQSLIAATSGKDFLNAAPAIGRIISGAKDVIAGIGSENYAQVGTGLKQAYDGFQEFESLMRSNARAENQLKAVRQEITDLEMRVQSLAIEMAAARESAFANERDALADILDARSNLGWRRISRQKFFADLVKLSLTSYYLDTSRDELRLSSNLIAIRSLLTSSPSRLADFNFTLPSSDCTIATGIRCIEIDAQGIGGVIRLNKAASPALKLPLLIVSPDIERFIMDSFGAFTDRSQVNIAPSSN